MNLRLALLSLPFFVALSPPTAAADGVPERLHFQCRLFDAGGVPVQQAGLAVTLRVYDQASGGTELYAEPRTVDVDAGLVSFAVGDVVALPPSLFDGGDLFLGLTVGGDAEMQPRFRVASVPFALRAGHADDVSGVDIDPQSVSVGGLPVIDASGNWVGPPSGLVGPPGPTGPQGPAGAEGAPGPAGPTGAPGPAGPVGPPGPLGPSGPAGPTGPTGPEGASPFTLNGNDAVYTQGNVGVGTQTPLAHLHVADTELASIWIEADTDDSGEAHTARLWFTQDGGSTIGHVGYDNLNVFQVAADAGTLSEMAFLVGGTERVRVDQSGRVGIGTTTPIAELDVSGAAHVAGEMTASGGFWVDSLEVIDSDGNWVGLGGVVGPTGPQGPVGPTGPAGPPGPDGAAGADGADGAQGPTGPQGPSGAQGPTGPQGSAGAQGPTGPQGPVGPAGPQGDSYFNEIGTEVIYAADGSTAGLLVKPTSITPGSSRLSLANDTFTLFRAGWEFDGGQLRAFGEDNLGTHGPHLVVQRAGGEVGIGTTTPVVPLQIAGNSLISAANADVLEGEEVVVEASDASLSLVSGDGGVAGSIFSMKEIDGNGDLSDAWALARATSGSGSDLHLKYGAAAAPWSNPTQVTITKDGSIGTNTNAPLGKLSVQNVGASDSTVLLNFGEGSQSFWIESGFAGSGESGNRIDFRTAWAHTPLSIRGDGFVGINTVTPTVHLDVNGDARFDTIEIVGGSDLVERFATEEWIEPGTVVVIDAAGSGELVPSRAPYDRCVAGVVSGAGGVQPGLALSQSGVLDGETLVAMAGRVYARCSVENGPIRPGDLLTTSSTPGAAMRASDAERWDGAVLGKAMGVLDEDGLVLVLVNLQ